MSDLPADLLAALPPGAVEVARRWWSSLSEADQRRVAGLWDERLEVQFFTPQPDDTGQVDCWEQVPTVVGGRFVPRDDAWGLSEWGPGYFEHLLQHPELVIVWEPVGRTFHIGCTRHPSARACLTSGEVPSAFVCPLGIESCPWEPLRGARLLERQSRSAQT
jgi:hypothetical protein